MLEEVDETTEAPEATDEASEPATEAPEAPAADATPDEAQEQLGPKERRRRARSQHSGEARPERSPEERARERAEQRKAQAEQRRRWRARERSKRGGETAEPPAPIEGPKGNPRVRQGVVVSDKADKTITVRIDSQRAHKTYGKQIRTSSTLHAHDEQNEAGTGDTVRVVESRPLSKTKRWRLVDILERAR